MTNTAPITLGQLFRFWRNLPHQAAAVIELEEDLQRNGYEAAMRRDRPWFSVWSQAGLQADEAWLAPATKVIQTFEGLSLTAYRCPAGQWTLGYGSTRLNGQPVREGDTLTTVEAEGLLRRELLDLFGPGLFALLPMAKSWRPEQQAALISWAFNVGLGAVEDSTLRRRLLAGEDPATVVREELPRWDKADGKPLAGLTRRRAAEVALFTGGAAPKFTPGSPFSFKVTQHITYGELALGEEARRFQHQHQCDMALELCLFAEKARAAFGGKPVIITSGYRPPAVNAAVGGASRSEHLFNAPGIGAIDFYLEGVPVLDLQQWADRAWSYSLGYGAPKGFIHVGKRRGAPRARWDY
jgi:GH24 family phage-related lysozyme (muramidase)